MLTGTNLKYTKAHNFRAVLETIRLYGPLSRSDIARKTTLTAQTISNIVGRLMDEALVQEVAKRQQGRGAPSTTLSVNPDGAYSVGLDLDRDHLTGVLVDLSGTVRQKQHFELNFPAPEEALPLMANTVQSLVEADDLATDDLSGLGVGFPGPFEIDGDSGIDSVVTPKAFPGWTQVPVTEFLQERIECPIFLKNNATAAAVGERWYGEGAPRSTFFYLLFGVGLGGGLVYKGHPYEGFSGNAGEVGYMPAPTTSSDGCDRPAHIGEHFNLPSLYERLAEAGYSAARPSDLEPLYEQGIPSLREWMETSIFLLTRLALSIEYLVDPEVVFFGGRLPTPMIEELREGVQGRLPDHRIQGKATTPTLRSATAGQDAAALGVATLPFYEFFTPPPTLLEKTDGRAEASLNP